MKALNLAPQARWTVFYYIFGLFILAVCRGYLFASNHVVFESLDWHEILRAFVDGMRFDLSTIILYTGIPSIFLFFPIYKKFWYYLFAFIQISLFVALLFVIAGDLSFFEESAYHIGNHLLIVGSDTGFLLKTAIFEYWHYLLFILFVFIFMFKMMIKIYRTKGNFHPPKLYTFFPKLLLLAAFIFYGVNGKVGIKIDRMISTSDAFSAGTVTYGNLVLNGGFTTFQVIKEKRWKNSKKHLSDNDAMDVTRRLTSDIGTTTISDNYPLLRKRDDFLTLFPNDKKINVMIIMLESWSSEYLDFFSGKKTGNTPCFDEIAKNGIVFSNFYPNGGMSLYGISATLTGLPPITRVPALGKGLEVSNLMRPGAIFNDLGYHTFAAQSSIRVSFRFDTIAKYLGFSDYFGKEDYPRKIQIDSPSNGWDGEMYDFLDGYLKNVKAPFFGFAFTGTTHVPYIVPDSYKRHPHENKGINGFYNTLYYSDSELGRFMDNLKKYPWFDDTLFVFVADHTLHRAVFSDEAKIPLVLYAPKYLKPKTVATLGSQVDIMATIYDLIHMQSPYSGIGKSLLRENDFNFSIGEVSRRLGFITADGVIQHDLKNRIAGTVKDDKLAQREKELLGLEQVIWQAIEHNKIQK